MHLLFFLKEKTKMWDVNKFTTSSRDHHHKRHHHLTRTADPPNPRTPSQKAFGPTKNQREYKRMQRKSTKQLKTSTTNHTSRQQECIQKPTCLWTVQKSVQNWKCFFGARYEEKWIRRILSSLSMVIPFNTLKGSRCCLIYSVNRTTHHNALITTPPW